MALDINDVNFSTALTANYTIDQLFTFLKDGFAQAGWGATVAEQNTTPKIAVYDINFNVLLTQARVRIALEITGGPTYTVRLRLHTFANYNIGTFTFTTNTGANGVTGATFTLNSTNVLTRFSLPRSQSEITGLALVESGVTFRGFLGIAYVSSWQSWWDENNWCRVLLVQPTLCNAFWHCYPNPQGVAAATVIPCRSGITTFATRNPANGLAYIIPEAYLTSHTWGISGQYSVDIGITNNSGFFINDISIVTPVTDEWWNMYIGDNGIAISIA